MHQPHAAATLMSCNSPEPATPPASRSWFAISPGFHANDPGTITPALSGRPPLNACNPYPYRPTSKHPVEAVFSAPIRCDTRGMTGILILSAVVALGGVVVWIALLLWAAREDGRDQERRDELRGH